MVTVDMGRPWLDRPDIPMLGEGRFMDQEMTVGNVRFRGTAVSMGNPHLIIFDPPCSEDIQRLAPLLGAHELFPRQTNVEFVKLENGVLDIQVYERGAGWTMACGTGACATVVAAALLGKVDYDKEIEDRLPGGRLWIKVSNDPSKVTMRGTASLVFEGQM